VEGVVPYFPDQKMHCLPGKYYITFPCILWSKGVSVGPSKQVRFLCLLEARDNGGYHNSFLEGEKQSFTGAYTSCSLACNDNQFIENKLF
jgi:hypothetical protein